MKSELQKIIQNSSAHTKNRLDNATFILNNPSLIKNLIDFSFDVNDKNHIRACCILEKVLELKLDLVFPFLDIVCGNLEKLKNDSAIRSISRFIMLMVENNAETTQKYLTENQIEKITETCFDWLISDIRVAPKANAIYTLYELGKYQDWIYPELKVILEQDALEQSAGYKATARTILKKI